MSSSLSLPILFLAMIAQLLFVQPAYTVAVHPGEKLRLAEHKCSNCAVADGRMEGWT